MLGKGHGGIYKLQVTVEVELVVSAEVVANDNIASQKVGII